MSDMNVTPTFTSNEGVVQTLAAGTHRSERVISRRWEAVFAHYRRLAASGGLSTADVFLDKSNFDDPDATVDDDWILGTVAVDMLGGTGRLNKESGLDISETPYWLRVRIVVAGGTIQIQVLLGGYQGL